MPAPESFSNDAETSLSAAISTTGQTSITVASASGFPASGEYRIRIDNEILKVTAGHGTTTWTVVRGQEGTSAATHSNSSVVSHVLTAQGLRSAAEEAALIYWYY